MSETKDPYNLQEALAAINAKRRAAGIAELAGFGQYISPTAPTEQEILRTELEAGQAQLIKRRIECGVVPPPASQEGTISPTLQEILNDLQPKGKKPSKRKTTQIHSIKVWSKLTLTASRRNYSGAIRAWTYAQNLDPHGSGIVSHDELISYLDRLGGTRSTRYRWVREAVASGFLCLVRNGQSYLIRSLKKVCELVGVDEPGQRIEVNAQALSQAGWKGLLWAGNLVGYSHPISRASLQQTTGVPIRTQKNYDKTGKVTSRANYAVDLTSDPDQIDGYREFRRPYAFIIRCGKTKRIAYRLPNTYQVPSTIRKSGGVTRSQYVRQQIAQSTVSVISENEATQSAFVSGGRESNFSAGGAGRGETRRLYFDRSADLRKMIRFRNRKGIRVERGDYYTLMAGGISRRIRYSGCQWWMVEKENQPLC